MGVGYILINVLTWWDRGFWLKTYLRQVFNTMFFRHKKDLTKAVDIQGLKET